MEATRAALVVAAHEFVDPKFQRLRSPAQDVEALADVLGNAAIGGFDVETLVNQSSAVVQQELERFFSGRKPEDLLLLYFSCHGVKDAAGRLYFVTTNTKLELLRSTGVSASFVSEQMEYSRSKRIVVVLDCCYSGAFLKGFRARGDETVAVDQLEGRGRAVITASRATEYAFEADQLAADNPQPSLFTGAIVEGLATGRADRNGDGVITVDEVYDYVYDAVRGKVAGQTPGRWIDVEGDLVVARNPNPPVRPAALPAELRRAVESDFALQRLGAVSELVQWYHSDDPDRQLAARAVLEQLSRDYDERVRRAATAAVAATPAPPSPEPVAEGMAGPASTDAGGSGTPVSRPSARREGAVAADGVARTAGWLAGIGGVAVLLAPYLTYLRYDDYSDKLSDREWFTLGAFVIFGLVVYGVYHLVVTDRSRGAGLAVLSALLPVVVGFGLVGVGDLVHDDAVVGPGPGWVLLELGFALLVGAGVLAAIHSRRHVALSPPSPSDPQNVRAGAATAATVVALVVGALASLGWARLLDLTGDGFIGVARPAQDLALRLLVISAAVILGWRSIRARGVSGGALGAAAAILFAAPVALFLGNGDIRGGGSLSFHMAFVAFAVGAAIVPVLSTVLVPVRHGATFLVAWAAASTAWVPASLASEGEGVVLVAALLGASLLAAFLARPRASATQVPG